MTETEKKALALVNECAGHDFVHPRDMKDKCWLLESICCAIEQHEAFRQEVSDALEKRGFYIDDRDLGRFILAKPDPLVEALGSLGLEKADEWAPDIRKALAARGLEVRKIGEGE